MPESLIVNAGQTGHIFISGQVGHQIKVLKSRLEE